MISKLAYVAVAVLCWSCRTADPGPSSGVFRFTFEGRDYQVLSVVEPPDGGYNVLVRRDGERVVLRARDDDQDGRLDAVLEGSVPLAEANRIYANGIRQAQQGGLYRERLAAPDTVRVLAFTKTAGYRHASIPDGVAALRQIGAEHRIAVDHTEDAGAFTDSGLAPYDAVAFLNTSADVLDAPAEAAFERFVRAGGGFVGVHAAADTEYDWPFYGALVGAYFDSHPAVQPATVEVVDRNHVSTRHLPARWDRTDEWYNFRAAPEGVRVLAALDEGTYEGGSMGDDHPVAWCHERLGGRAWYTAGGHAAEAYAEPLFRAHLAGGLLYATGLAPDRCTAGD
jgi:type 1 glutamine amidotransferase